MSGNVQNINQNKFQNICRTCLNICDIKFFKDHVISNIFYKLTDTHFKTNDLPQQICLKCFEKINEIHEFASQCKRSHSTLTDYLNTKLNEKQVVIESLAEQERYEIEIKLEDNITIHEELYARVKDENFDPLNVDVKVELGTTENHFEINNDVLNENVIPETRDINGSHRINSFEGVCTNDDVSNKNVNLSDCNKETYSSDGGSSFIVDSVKNRKKEANKSKFKCGDCKKIFVDLKTLNDHKRIPSFMCPYKCQHCLKSFTILYTFKQHLRIHERPYKCDQCPRSFFRLKNLKTHKRRHPIISKRYMRIHSGERSYKCDQCSKSYKRQSNLRVHMRMHRPHECNQCWKTFNELSVLKRHMLSHQRIYKCGKCPKSYCQSGTLRKHIKKEHTNT